MTKKNRLQKILAILTPDKTAVDFAEFDNGIIQLKKALKEKVQAQTLDDVNRKLEDFRKKFDLSKLEATAEDIKEAVDTKINELSELVNAETTKLAKLTDEGLDLSNSEIAKINSILDVYKIDLDRLQSAKDNEVAGISIELSDIKQSGLEYVKNLETLASELSDIKQSVIVKEDELRGEIKVVGSDLEKVRLDLSNRINNMPRGGGNANRNISIGGNASTLSRYTDINLKAGSNVTLSYANNDITKNTDITIAATGGSGSTRSINRESTSQTMGSVVGTDYVYVATAGVQLTLPTAVGNSNLYTVKNVAASSVMIATTGGQTIDGDSNIILNNQYTSVDIVNDGNDNWSIT